MLCPARKKAFDIQVKHLRSLIRYLGLSQALPSPLLLVSPSLFLCLYLYYCMEGEFRRIKNIICLIHLASLSPGSVAFPGTTHLDALRLE